MWFLLHIIFLSCNSVEPFLPWKDHPFTYIFKYYTAVREENLGMLHFCIEPLNKENKRNDFTVIYCKSLLFQNTVLFFCHSFWKLIQLIVATLKLPDKFSVPWFKNIVILPADRSGSFARQTEELDKNGHLSHSHNGFLTAVVFDSDRMLILSWVTWETACNF